MGLFKRSGVWHYHFEINGKRYRRSLRTKNRKQAERAQARAFANASADAGEPLRPLRRKAAPDRVYLVRTGEFYKIGITSNLERRVSGMRTDSPQIEVVGSWVRGDARQIERSLHARFSGKRVSRELFRLAEADIEEIKRIVWAVTA